MASILYTIGLNEYLPRHSFLVRILYSENTEYTCPTELPKDINFRNIPAAI